MSTTNVQAPSQSFMGFLAMLQDAAASSDFNLSPEMQAFFGQMVQMMLDTIPQGGALQELTPAGKYPLPPPTGTADESDEAEAPIARELAEGIDNFKSEIDAALTPANPDDPSSVDMIRFNTACDKMSALSARVKTTLQDTRNQQEIYGVCDDLYISMDRLKALAPDWNDPANLTLTKKLNLVLSQISTGTADIASQMASPSSYEELEHSYYEGPRDI